MTKYSELLKIYKQKDGDLNLPYAYSGSGCFFHDIDEFKNFTDVDDDKVNPDSILNRGFVKS